MLWALHEARLQHSRLLWSAVVTCPHNTLYKTDLGRLFFFSLFSFIQIIADNKIFTLLSTVLSTTHLQGCFRVERRLNYPWLGTWLGKVVPILFDELGISRGYTSDARSLIQSLYEIIYEKMLIVHMCRRK